MKTLHITVENKIATYHDRDGAIVCNNSDYEIAFSFDGEWKDHPVKTARFIYNGKFEDVVFTGNNVAVPVIKNATSVIVGVYSGDLKTTTPAKIECKKSILCGDGVPPDPSPDVYDQIINLLNSGGSTAVLEARIEEVYREVQEQQFTVDGTLTLSKDRVLSVNVTDKALQDNTLPISSSAVHTIVGNIEVLLNTI